MSGSEASSLLAPLLADPSRRPVGPLLIPTIDQVRPRGLEAVEVAPPGSKSLTNRAILLAALAKGVSTLRRPLVDAADAEVMLEA
ncbi:MAG: hypothetical protein RL689_154, partial [Planctomycetota bacterium]